MKNKKVVYGFTFIILSLVFYPLIDFLIKDLARSLRFALYGTYSGQFYGFAEETFLLMIAYTIGLVVIILFGLSGTYFAYRKTSNKKYMIRRF